jgi:alkaline phosphatase
MTTEQEAPICLGRRALLKNGALVLTAAAVGPSSLLANQTQQTMNIGLVTDLHYANKPPAGSRHYRETLDKLAEAGKQFSKDAPAFIVELGDFVDAADSVAAELGYLKRINKEFSSLCKHRHYVLGNHCVHTLTKQEFLDGVEQPEAYYGFDAGEFHFVVLDSCYRSDGTPYGRKNFEWTDPNLPSAELEWLKADLQQTSKRTIVFVHQRLDVSNHYGVKNGAEVRRVLEESGNVLAVFQGHSHQNDYKDIAGIHYCTLVAMVEGSGPQNNGYTVMNLTNDGTIRIHGFRKQASYEWSP